MLLSTQADAGVTSCGPADSPAPYNSVLNCAAFGPPVCTAIGDTVTCNASACTGGTEDFVAINYTGSNDVSVFGQCELSGGPATTFCCHIDDFSASYGTITLIGSKNDDIDMGFRYGAFQLAESTPNSMLAEANGGNGDDVLSGSNRNAGAYTEILRGDKGDDTLRGGSGNDKIYGGSGNDVCSATTALTRSMVRTALT